jgi:NTE family protein
VVIRPRVNDIGPADFEQRNRAILEGEKAALAAMPQIRAKLAQLRATRQRAEADRLARARAAEEAKRPKCEKPGMIGGLFGKDEKCTPAPNR